MVTENVMGLQLIKSDLQAKVISSPGQSGFFGRWDLGIIPHYFDTHALQWYLTTLSPVIILMDMQHSLVHGVGFFF